ncbi:esterase/lipase family protein [Paenibacillus sp. S-38]|uniref:esterase/lipase family protein n=1 Tax=Paenibacillus sp. S-38 TaxID=3416710 RepID=UPI003CFA91A1
MRKSKVLISAFISMVMVFSLFLFTPASHAAGEEAVENATTAHTPIVFVHGLSGSSSNFIYIKAYLKSQGWSDDELYAIELPSKQGNQLLNSAALDSFVDSVRSKTGHTHVNIIAHSMGGANSLYYILNRSGSSKVDKLITLGGANRLTTSSAPEGVNVTSIYSTSDTIVANYLSILTGANNIQISGVSHIGLIFSSRVNELILTALQQ